LESSNFSFIIETIFTRIKFALEILFFIHFKDVTAFSGGERERERERERDLMNARKALCPLSHILSPVLLLLFAIVVA
jgi:hypothetical protein